MAIRLISRQKYPPGGWMFRQAETGWANPRPMDLPFNETVKLIIAHRRSNPSFALSHSFDSVAWELENFTCLRLKNSDQWCASDDPKDPAKTPAPRATKKHRCSTC